MTSDRAVSDIKLLIQLSTTIYNVDLAINLIPCINLGRLARVRLIDSLLLYVLLSTGIISASVMIGRREHGMSLHNIGIVQLIVLPR